MEKPTAARRLSAEQSNVSVILGEKTMLKIYRRLQTGIQPDVEVGRFLTEIAGFTGTPSYLGSAAFVHDDAEMTTLATAFAFVYNQGDAWTGLLDALTRHLEHATITAMPESEPFGYPLNISPIIGRRTAELHAAFAHPTDDPAFAVRSIRKADLRAWARSVSREIRQCFSVLEAQLKTAPEDVAADIRALMAKKDAILRQVRSVESLTPSGGKSRVHGDYHLGQVLICQDDVMIVDFEGEPQRSLDERRQMSSPLRDAAGMLRSFDYLAWAALDRRRSIVGQIPDAEQQRAMQWRDEATRVFLDAYLEGIVGTASYPNEAETADGLLRLFTIQKAIYEIGYEGANRPAWLPIPIRGVLDLLNREALVK